MQGHYVTDDSADQWITRLRVLSESLLSNDERVQADGCKVYLAAVNDARARTTRC
jgi:hypothetical protein